MMATRFQFMCSSNNKNTELRWWNGATTRENVEKVCFSDRLEAVHPVEMNGM